MVESEETTYWYVEKDKSWNLAAAILYVKKDECCWKGRNNLLICLETTTWSVKKDKYGWKCRNRYLIC